MEIQLPDLGDVTFDALMQEMTTSIPKYTQEWTNFNPTDPGITLLELFAWIGEGLMYQCDRLPDSLLINFLKLVVGRSLYVKDDSARCVLRQYLRERKAELKKGIPLDLMEMKAQTQAFLNSGYRAITAEDFKRLVWEALPSLKPTAADSKARVEVFTTSHGVEIILISKMKGTELQELIEQVKKYLEPRRLVGTFYTVRLPKYTSIKLWIFFDYKAYAAYQIDQVKTAVRDQVYHYFDPLKGGPEGTGWPYAKSVNKYELIHVIEKVAGVANVVSIDCNGDYEWVSYPVEGLVCLDEPVLELGWEETPQ